MVGSPVQDDIATETQPQSIHAIVSGAADEPANTVTHEASCNTTVVVTRVLSTPELLELILEQVHPQDLLVNCSRVCKSFKEMIKSKRLRRRMMLEPAPADWSFGTAILIDVYPALKRYRESGFYLCHLDDAEGVEIAGLDIYLDPFYRDLKKNCGGLSMPSNLLLTQPPSRRQDACLHCIEGMIEDEKPSEGYDFITNGDITLGELWRIAGKVWHNGNRRQWWFHTVAGT